MIGKIEDKEKEEVEEEEIEEVKGEVVEEKQVEQSSDNRCVLANCFIRIRLISQKFNSCVTDRQQTG